MKKLSVGLLIIFIIMMMVSCGENTGTDQTQLDELKDRYDRVGISHNKELDIMLEQYRSQNRALSIDECRRMADAHFGNSGTAIDIANLIGDTRRFSKSTVSSDIVEILSDSIDVFADYPAIYDSICQILDSPLTAGDKIIRLEMIYLQIDETVENEDEKTSIMSGLSTTIHSLEYWDENFGEWEQTLTGSLGKKSLGIIGCIGIVDGAGAVIGTLEGIRDTYKGQEGRGEIILGRAVGEAAKTSLYAVLAIVLI